MCGEPVGPLLQSAVPQPLQLQPQPLQQRLGPQQPPGQEGKGWGAPPRSLDLPSPMAAGADPLSLLSRCCGGRDPETGAPAPAAPCCPTELSCSSPRLRRAWPWHPQVRAVPLQVGRVPCPPGATCCRLHPACPTGQGAGEAEGSQSRWGGMGQGSGAVPQSQEHRCRGAHTTPALPCPCRAARRVPPGALQPLPLSPPSRPPCTQHPRPAPLRTLLPGGRPPRGWRMAKPQPCTLWVSGPALWPPEQAPACKG